METWRTQRGLPKSWKQNNKEKKASKRSTNSDSKPKHLPPKGSSLICFPLVQNRVTSNIFIFTPLLPTLPVLEGFLGGTSPLKIKL